MKSTIKIIVIGLLTLFSGMEGFGPKTLVGLRSPAFSGARELTGWQQLIYRPDLDTTNATLAIMPEYNHSFRSHEIKAFLLGCTPFIFSGSQVAGRSETDMLADYFGLPSDFRSEVDFAPIIVNFMMDFDLRIGLDSCTPGLYLQLHMPIVHAKWDLKMVECVVDPGTTFTSYPAGYLAATPLELSALTVGPTAPKNVTTAFQGKAQFGDMQEPLQFGKIFGRQSQTRVSELWLTFGYNFLLADWYHAGAALLVAAPTGTVRTSEFLFEPMIGNDHHWELGGELTGHVDLWAIRESDRKISLFFDAKVTHMFTSRQKRSFDLIRNGPGSRYMLLEQIATPAVGLHDGLFPNNVPAINQYEGFLVPAINKTTLNVDVSIGAQVDLVFKLGYAHRGFEFDFGYELWVKTAEKCGDVECFSTCPNGNYAIKGDAQIYGFTNPAETPVALAATQSRATINQGQTSINVPFTDLSPGNFNEGLEFANINADNIINASDTLGIGLQQLTAADAVRLGITQLNVRTSNPPILVTNSDIDICSALLPRAISSKLFFYLGYSLEREDLSVIPYLGGGGFIEWADMNTRKNSATNQWGVWLKFGLSYGT